MNNDDERDHAEERFNRNLMRDERDPDDEEGGNPDAFREIRCTLTVRVPAGDAVTAAEVGLAIDGALDEGGGRSFNDWGRWVVGGVTAEELPDGETGDDIARLTALAAEIGASELDLDEDVHDLFSSMAADVNNGGVASQVTCLVRECGAAEAERLIRQAGDDSEPDDEEDPGPQDGDGQIVLDRDRYYVSLGARHLATGFPDRTVAIYELAALMAEEGDFPGAWISGEHGPAVADIGDEVRAFHDEGGTLLRLLRGVVFTAGTTVRAQNDGALYTVIRDYGTLGIWLHVTGDPSQERFVRDAGQTGALVEVD